MRLRKQLSLTVTATSLLLLLLLLSVAVEPTSASTAAAAHHHGHDHDHGHREGVRDVGGGITNVHTSYGWVVGNSSDSARWFKGIPYATQPVGMARLREPQDALPWFPEFLVAVDDPPACPQQCTLAPVLCPHVQQMSESCLYLNIFTPIPSDAGSLWPVIIYLHAGDFEQGWSGGPMHDATAFAAKANTVVVTANYRLGALGTLILDGDAQGEAAPGGPSHDDDEIPFELGGNLGVADQRMVLKWVQENIRAFGGDSSRVTLWGAGAGATSVAIHMSTPESWPYFHRAILDGNPFGVPFRNASGTGDLSRAFLQALHCQHSMLRCLQEASITDILQAQATAPAIAFASSSLASEAFPWSPVVGAGGLTTSVANAWKWGKVAPVPVIVGSTDSAATRLVYSRLHEALNATAYKKLLMTAFGSGNVVAINRQYPVNASSTQDHRPILAQVLGDALYRCPERNLTLSAAMGTRSPAFLYQFNHVWSFARFGWGQDQPYCWDKACAGSELPFALDSAFSTLFQPAEQQLSHSMVNFWSSFAATGKPAKDASAGSWPAAAPASPSEAAAAVRVPGLPGSGSPGDATMLFNAPGSAAQPHFVVQCQLWDDILTPNLA